MSEISQPYTRLNVCFKFLDFNVQILFDLAINSSVVEVNEDVTISSNEPNHQPSKPLTIGRLHYRTAPL